MIKRNFKYIFFALILAFFVFFKISIPAKADTDLEASKTDLEQQLQVIEKQIASYEEQLNVTKKEKNTLVSKIKQLKTQQASLRAQIKATAIKIDSLNQKLETTKKSIDVKTTKLNYLQGKMLITLRALERQDNNLFLTLATNDGFRALFDKIQDYITISSALRRVLSETKQAKNDLQIQKIAYDEQKNDAENLLDIKSLQQKQLVDSLTEHSTLLDETKGKENSYQTLLEDTKKRAAQIRNRIYELSGGGSKQISFGEAVTIAQGVSKQTGIRVAFLLAILTQESNLGKNVGTCNRPGDPPEKSWTVVMKPERDQEPFKQITSELGLDPNVTPVSCPMRDKKGNQIGWGGAMGPAQFIPSTWMGVKNKVSSLTGKSTANPWDIRDAFMAAGIKLTSNGADGTKDGDWKAAMRYFSGSTNKKFRFYGDNVLATAERYEQDIIDLQKISISKPNLDQTNS